MLIFDKQISDYRGSDKTGESEYVGYVINILVKGRRKGSAQSSSKRRTTALGTQLAHVN